MLALPENKSIETRPFHPKVPSPGLGPCQKWQIIIDTEQQFFSPGRVFDLYLFPVKQQMNEMQAIVALCPAWWPGVHDATSCYPKRRGLESALAMGYPRHDWAWLPSCLATLLLWVTGCILLLAINFFPSVLNSLPIKPLEEARRKQHMCWTLQLLPLVGREGCVSNWWGEKQGAAFPPHRPAKAVFENLLFPSTAESGVRSVALFWGEECTKKQMTEFAFFFF